MEGFKREIKRIKDDAKRGSVEDSEWCWELFPGKNKSKHSECSKKAVVGFHVFSQGKREIKAEKSRKLAECAKVEGVKESLQCRSQAYLELTSHLSSLERWIDRERKKFRSEY